MLCPRVIRRGRHRSVLADRGLADSVKAGDHVPDHDQDAWEVHQMDEGTINQDKIRARKKPHPRA